MKSRLLGAMCACAATLAWTSASGIQIYDIAVTGLTDTEHTRNDGYRWSSTQLTNSTGVVAVAPATINEAGQVAGVSQRFNGGAEDLGQSVWLYSEGSTTNISLADTEHTRFDGYRSNDTFSWLNKAGQVIGFAERYNGAATWLGRSVWLYSGGSTTNIGLTDTEYTRNDGWRNSFTDGGINEAGQVSGSSDRFNGGSTFLGKTAWLYSGTTRVFMGLTDTEHTRSGGYQYNTPIINGLNEAGQVMGLAQRYNGGTAFMGRSAWLYSGGSTTNIGLTDTVHTDSNGFQNNIASSINEAGQVIGNAERYNGGATSVGRSAWLSSGGSTTNISLTDTEHTRSGGDRFSSAMYLNEAGQVTGYAQRYNGGTFLGRSTWLYSGGSTIVINPTDAEHTRNDGWRDSIAKAINEAGQVAGTAQRYNGGTIDLGRSVWLYSGGSTTAINPADTMHTRSDGYRFSDTFDPRSGSPLNEVGQVAGTAQRYNGGTIDLGQSAWLYDLTLDQTFSLDISLRSDGYAYSSATYLGDDGLLLGSYQLFDTDDTLLGERAFSFTLDDGVLDLGGLVDGGLDTAGWESLASAISANDGGLIIGYGLLNDMPGGQMSYILSPQIVPIPPAVYLFGSGLIGLVGVARRKKAV